MLAVLVCCACPGVACADVKYTETENVTIVERFYNPVQDVRRNVAPRPCTKKVGEPVRVKNTYGNFGTLSGLSACDNLSPNGDRNSKKSCAGKILRQMLEIKITAVWRFFLSCALKYQPIVSVYFCWLSDVFQRRILCCLVK